jgi:predicted PurR-regulated permease PerM
MAEVIRDHPVLQQLKDAVAGGGQGGGLVGGLQALGSQALSAGRGVVRWVGTLACWVMLPIYFSFFLISDPRQVLDLERHLPFLKQQTRSDVGYLVREFVNILVAFFRGQLVIAFLQGLLFAIGFTLAGLSYGFVIGLTLGFLNIIPYLGNIVGLAVALPLAFFQPGGGWLTLLLTIAVFVAVQTIEGYLLTPKIMGDRTGLHPMIIIVAVFFWGTALSGITGMVLAIPLTAFLVVFWRLARERYIKELV